MRIAIRASITSILLSVPFITAAASSGTESAETQPLSMFQKGLCMQPIEKLTVYHRFLGLSAEWKLGRLNICQCFRASSARSRSKNLLSITSVSAARSLKTSKDLSSLTDSETHASEISTFIYFSLPSLSAVLSSEPATFDSQPGTGPGRALARPAQGRFQHATFSVVMALTSLRLHLPESATDTYWRNIKYPVTVVT